MKNKIITLIFLLWFTIIFLLPIDLNWFSFWMDNGWLLDSKNSILNYLYWRNPDLLGNVNFTSYTSLFHYILSYLFLNLFWYTYWYYFMYFFIIFIILMLWYLITYIYIKDKYYALIISWLFIFNLPFLRFFYWQWTLTFFIATIWFLLSILVILKINSHNINKSLILLTLSSLLISHPFLFFFYIIITSALLLFYKKISLKKFIFLWIGIFLINFFWIFQFVIWTIINFWWLGQKDYSDSLVSVFSMYSQLYNSFLFLWKNSDYITEFFGWTSIFIFFNIIILWYLFLKITIKNKINNISIILLILLLFLITFSIGWREPLWIIYSYLYNNISFFSFFRTFSNVLLFAFYIFLLFLIINVEKKNYFYLWYTCIIFIICFFTSISYYSYNKTVNIPNDYFIVKDIIDKNVSWKNVMLLPCSTYDYYSWDTGKQDKYFLESYLNHNSIIFYRPTLSNYETIKNLFNQVCEYNFTLSNLNNYNIEYILLRKDLIYSERYYYQDFNEVMLEWFQKVYEGDYLSLYQLNTNHNSIDFIYQSPIKYISKFTISNVKEIFIPNNFNPNWKLYLKNQQWIFSKPLFENTHHLVYDYANWWTISKDEIIKYVDENYSKELQKEWYPKQIANGKLDYKYYILNSDGSIDVELTLYFKPQSYFYLGLIISGTTFIILVWYLTISYIRNRKEEIISEID